MAYSPEHFYHLVFDSNLQSVRAHGLRSTKQLLSLANVPSIHHEDLLTTHRAESLFLSKHIVLRDQIPMPPSALEKALPKHVKPGEWYRFLNNFVFLWPDLKRLQRHWRAGSATKQSILVLDAQKILKNLPARVHVSAINSGNARRNPSPRSLETIVSYRDWEKSGWPSYLGKKRPSKTLPAEILVKDSLPLEPYLLGTLPAEILLDEGLDRREIDSLLRKQNDTTKLC